MDGLKGVKHHAVRHVDQATRAILLATATQALFTPIRVTSCRIQALLASGLSRTWLMTERVP